MGHFQYQKMLNLHPRPQFQPTKKPPVPVGLKVLTIRGPQQQYEGTRPHCGSLGMVLQPWWKCWLCVVIISMTSRFGVAKTITFEAEKMF